MNVAWYLCGLNENVPCWLLCLNTWSLVGSAFLAGLGSLGDVELLDEVCHWRQTLRL